MERYLAQANIVAWQIGLYLVLMLCLRGLLSQLFVHPQSQ